MNGSAVLLSIRPKHAQKIFARVKTAELRRVRPKSIATGSLVLIYTSSPVCSLTGAFLVDRVLENSIHNLWQSTKDKAALDRDEFYAYFDGAVTGIAILFSQVWRLERPIELEYLRERIDFHPPQGFRYVTGDDLSLPRIARFISETGASYHYSRRFPGFADREDDRVLREYDDQPA